MNLALAVSALIFCCFIIQWFSWRIKSPAILFLLLFGIIIGPVFNVFNPDKIFGDFFYPFVSLAVGLILFEGSLSLRFSEIKGLETVIRRLITIGALVTIFITTIVAYYSLDISWKISLLFGCITVVTGPTVIAPILRVIRPTKNIANILKWESILIDPIGAILSVLVYEFIILGAENSGLITFVSFVKIAILGIVLGIVAGYLYGFCIRNHWIPEYLLKVSSLAIVLMVFEISNILAKESGLLTVTIMGIFLANQKDLDLSELIDFKETISVILISILFICLAAKIDIVRLKEIGFNGILVLLAIQFLSRPISVVVSTYKSKLKWNERHMIAWIAPRGIIAAAVSFLFSLGLKQHGFYEHSMLVPLTFEVIIFTVLLQGLTARFVAKFLNVSVGSPQGFLIIGSNLVARTIAKSLHDNGIQTILADPGWEGISQARIMGLNTYYGNPMSEHADRTLDLTFIGKMMAITPVDWVNVSAMLHFSMELGKENVFSINTTAANKKSERKKIDYTRYGHLLFSDNVDYTTLYKIFSKGITPKTTTLTEKFDFKDFITGDMILLFAINPSNEVFVFYPGHTIKPKPGWKMIYVKNTLEDGA